MANADYTFQQVMNGIGSSTNNKQYLHQQSWESFKSTYEQGNVDTAVQPLTFSREGSDVIFKWG